MVLRDEKAQAVILEETEGKAKIIGQKEEHFSASIDDVSQEEFLEKLDKAISSAESSLPEDIQTQKTIFGVKESWANNDQIKKDSLIKLKKASDELGLIPIGFLVTSQAISHLLQKEEGAPVSAILAEINKKSLTVTLLRAGKSIETKSSEIHESIPFTVDTLLKHFDIPEILPSRIIIFNGKEDLSQEFISHAWSKSLPFLHLPQIYSLPYGFDAKAVLLGAAKQLGFEVLEIDLPEESHIVSQPEKETRTTREEDSIEKPILYKNSGAQDFGFVKDIDVAKNPVEKKQPALAVNEVNEGVVEEEIPQVDIGEEVVLAPSKKSDNIPIHIVNVLTSILGSIFAIAKRINFKKNSSGTPSGKLRFIIPAILILIIMFIVSYFLFLKAAIEITVDPKILEQNKSVVFTTTGATDSNENTIKGEFITVSEDGTVSTAATGKKDIGTNAKGTVTIFNSLTQSKTLAQGTTLKSPNGLEFTLDSQTTVKGVASHSADETVTPEKITANVTADQLGKESNLPSGTKFSVGSFDTSDLVAKNDNPFSGGTKKEVTVASKNDSAKLEADLVKQLENKAKEDLQKQLDQNKILLPTLTAESLSKKSLNVKIGDETNQVTLTGTVEYQGISYNKSDLAIISKSLLSKNILSNQEVDYNNIKISVLDIKNKNDEKVEANLSIKALLLPKMDKNKLAKDLRGKSFKASQDLIFKFPQIANVVIKLSPNIPFLPKSLPRREKNIIIIIKING